MLDSIPPPHLFFSCHLLFSNGRITITVAVQYRTAVFMGDFAFEPRAGRIVVFKTFIKLMICLVVAAVNAAFVVCHVYLQRAIYLYGTLPCLFCKVHSCGTCYDCSVFNTLLYMESVDQPAAGDLTNGNLKKQLWSLAWPIMLSIFFYTLYNIVDTIWVGRLSTESIAAVSISQIALFAMVALGMGITVGSGVLISMRIGKKDKDGAGQVLGQSFVLAALVGLLFTIISLAFRESILVFSGATGAVLEPATSYFTIVSAGAVLMFLMMTVVFAFNSQGDSFTPTKLFAGSTLLNIILDPLFIFGWGAFPALGIAGAAYATLISQTLFIGSALYVLSSEKRLIPFKFKNLTLEFQSVKEVFKIGFPASLTQVMQPLGLAVLMYITAQHFMELGTVAFSIAFRLEFFAYLPAIGFGFGSMAIIGQNIGAKKFDRAKETFKLALTYGVGAAVGVTVLAMLFSKLIIGVFTTDPAVVADVTSYLFITGITYAFLAAALIAISTFQAIGQSWPGFWLTVLRLVIVSIPVAYIAVEVFSFSIAGVWFALAAGNVAGAVVGVFLVQRKFTALEKAEEATA